MKLTISCLTYPTDTTYQIWLGLVQKFLRRFYRRKPIAIGYLNKKIVKKVKFWQWLLQRNSSQCCIATTFDGPYMSIQFGQINNSWFSFELPLQIIICMFNQWMSKIIWIYALASNISPFLFWNKSGTCTCF